MYTCHRFPSSAQKTEDWRPQWTLLCGTPTIRRRQRYAERTHIEYTRTHIIHMYTNIFTIKRLTWQWRRRRRRYDLMKCPYLGARIAAIMRGKRAREACKDIAFSACIHPLLTTFKCIFFHTHTHASSTPVFASLYLINLHLVYFLLAAANFLHTVFYYVYRSRACLSDMYCACIVWINRKCINKQQYLTIINIERSGSSFAGVYVFRAQWESCKWLLQPYFIISGIFSSF